ncbi:MAG: 3,4-dihydroxy 2-butanone 4-phosphate synthase [Solirubrobacteraceae bacterium]|nr:3,4-dihydroxy 2-butanone 4-phosphate synthase [Solirubrobacteraceae bacterium]
MAQSKQESVAGRLEATKRALAQGGMVVLAPGDGSPGTGNLLVAARYATPESVATMARHGGGLVRLALPMRRCLELQVLAHRHTPHRPGARSRTLEEHQLLSVEAREGVGTGISAADRARTLRVAASPAAGAQELVCPGHIPVVTPLAERVPTPAAAALELCKQAGAWRAAALCHVLAPSGDVATTAELRALAQELELPFVTADEVLLPEGANRHRSLPIDHALMSIGA